MVKPSTRRAALISYLGPVVVLFVVVGLGLIYWANRTPMAQTPAPIDGGIGTTGSEIGGGGAEPDLGGTRDEIEYRGDTEKVPGAAGGSGDVVATVRAASAASAGQRVALRNVEVAEVRSDVLWVHDGDNRIAVTIPEGAATIPANSRVDVDGTTETHTQGVRVRASRVQVR
jgi:uncharacterized protein YdeI (BOF family)